MKQFTSKDARKSDSMNILNSNNYEYNCLGRQNTDTLGENTRFILAYMFSSVAAYRADPSGIITSLRPGGDASRSHVRDARTSDEYLEVDMACKNDVYCKNVLERLIWIFLLDFVLS